MIGNLFNTILYQPLFNALIFLYAYLPGHDFGVAIIILTVVIRLVLYPLMAQSIKSQKVLNELQPKIQEVQKKHQGDKQQQAKAMMDLYQKEKFNPFGGCLPMLIQLPLLIALYQVFWKGFQEGQLGFLYSFVPNPGAINPMFLGLVNLTQPNIIFAVLAGVFQFFQSKMMMPARNASPARNAVSTAGWHSDAGGPQKNDQMAQFSGMMQKQMIYLLPLFTVFILWKLPAAVGVYWLVTTLFSIVQQYLIYRVRNSPPQGPSGAQARA
jgi:YidC/Oxa1 family membrane protein insertase